MNTAKQRSVQQRIIAHNGIVKVPIDHQYLIRNMVVYTNSSLPASMYGTTQQDHRG